VTFDMRAVSVLNDAMLLMDVQGFSHSGMD